MALNELWNQFKSEAQTGYRLFSRDVDREQMAGATRTQRYTHVTREFFWAILTKLSPARRVILLLALVLLLIPTFEFQGGNRHIMISGSGGQFIGVLLILGLLLMEVADRVTMKRDLQIAREIQLWLVPEKAPDVAGMQFAFFNRPANTVAGDYYDVFRRQGPDANEGPVLLIVADVAGKSLPAALLMATLQASLHTLSAQCTSLLELVAGLNRYACDHSRNGQRFTTAFVGEYDPHSGTLTYINAGHNAPVLLHADGRLERLTEGGVPLGIDPAAPYAAGQVVLGSGDALVVFTDGFVEAVNASGQEFGDARLISAVQGNRVLPAKDLLAGMVRSLDAFVSTTAQHDDITCMIAKRI